MNSDVQWHFIRFVEDGILHICSEEHIKRCSKTTRALWPLDCKWYEAEIISSGDKCTVTKMKKNYKHQAALVTENCHGTAVAVRRSKREKKEATVKPKKGGEKDNTTVRNGPGVSASSNRVWRQTCNVGLEVHNTGQGDITLFGGLNQTPTIDLNCAGQDEETALEGLKTSLGPANSQELDVNDTDRSDQKLVDGLIQTPTLDLNCPGQRGDTILEGLKISLGPANSQELDVNDTDRSDQKLVDGLIQTPTLDLNCPGQRGDTVLEWLKTSLDTANSQEVDVNDADRCNQKLVNGLIQTPTLDLNCAVQRENTVLEGSNTSSDTANSPKLDVNDTDLRDKLSKSMSHLELVDGLFQAPIQDINYTTACWDPTSHPTVTCSSTNEFTTPLISSITELDTSFTTTFYLMQSNTVTSNNVVSLETCKNESTKNGASSHSYLGDGFEVGNTSVKEPRNSGNSTCSLYQYSSEDYVPPSSDDSSSESTISLERIENVKPNKINILSDVSIPKQDPIEVPHQGESTISLERIENVKPNKINILSDVSIPKQGPIEVPHQSENGNILFFPEVKVATLVEGKKRMWDKRFLCTFCKQDFSKLPRHWYKMHPNEREIAYIMSLNKNSKERKRLIAALQNRGNFINNTNIIKSGEGKVMPKRRGRCSVPRDLKEVLPCKYCYQMFAKNYLSKHQRNCTFKSESKESCAKNKLRSNRSINMMMLPIGPSVSEEFKNKILSKMSGDQISEIVRYDSLIIQYGETEFARMGYDARYHRTIIDRCREMARVLMTAKVEDPNIFQFKQLLRPNRYQLLKKCVYLVAGYNSENNTFASPSFTLKIGITIRKCVAMLKGDYLEDDILKLQVPVLDSFLAVMEAKWSREINAHAYRTLSEKRWNVPKRLPITKDIQKLHNHLLGNCEKAALKLRSNPNVLAYQMLTENTLVRVIMLNRKRVGDVQFIKLIEYENRQSVNPDSDVFQTLSDGEKELSKSLMRLVVRGKKGRGVPLLLTPELHANIQLITENREKCGVDVSNPYLFPSTKHTSGCYLAHHLFRKFSKEAGCESPDTISSTKLRKHVAVTVQLLNLRKNELDALANFMGHDIRVHRQYYRLADETMQLAKISKILLNMDKGNYDDMKGKNLDEIEVDDYLSEHEKESDGVDDSDQEEQQTESVRPQNKNTPPRLSKKRKNKETIRNEKKKKNTPEQRKHSVRVPWNIKDKTIVINHFKNYISTKMIPGKVEIEKFYEKKGATLTIRKPWRKVKDLVYNEIKKIK